MKTIELIAQTTNPAVPASQPAPFWANPMFGLMLGIIVLYFFIFRSKRTQDKKRANQLNSLKRGDRVQTIGGMLGTVVDAKEDEVVLKVDETSNTKIRFSRNAIHRVLGEEPTK